MSSKIVSIFITLLTFSCISQPPTKTPVQFINDYYKLGYDMSDGYFNETFTIEELDQLHSEFVSLFLNEEILSTEFNGWYDYKFEMKVGGQTYETIPLLFLLNKINNIEYIESNNDVRIEVVLESRFNFYIGEYTWDDYKIYFSTDTEKINKYYKRLQSDVSLYFPGAEIKKEDFMEAYNILLSIDPEDHYFKGAVMRIHTKELHIFELMNENSKWKISDLDKQLLEYRLEF